MTRSFYTGGAPEIAGNSAAFADYNVCSEDAFRLTGCRALGDRDAINACILLGFLSYQQTAPNGTNRRLRAGGPQAILDPEAVPR